MEYMKLYENFDKIYKICQDHNISNYSINQDGSIDVIGSVNFDKRRLKKLPLKFGKVSGYFSCTDNLLTSLEGSPRQVYGGLFCANNRLTTLIGGPIRVNGDYSCWNNKLLTDVYGFPDYFGDGSIKFYHTPVQEILSIFNYSDEDGYEMVMKLAKFIKWLNEYDVIRDGNKIVEMRLEEAYWMAAKRELPMDNRTFKHYKLI